jgi:uncharacterized ion transporter superfamily protein YfcC
MTMKREQSIRNSESPPPIIKRCWTNKTTTKTTITSFALFYYLYYETTVTSNNNDNSKKEKSKNILKYVLYDKYNEASDKDKIRSRTVLSVDIIILVFLLSSISVLGSISGRTR